MVNYIPRRGDVVWLEFNPQLGKEIRKRRPAFVISPQLYNQKTSLALFMPVTSQIKGYPFEWILDIPEVRGAILCDQIRSLDWKAREAKYIVTLPKSQILEIIEKFSLLLE